MNTLYVCDNCVKHPALKKLISDSNEINTCGLCSKGSKVVDVQMNDFRQLFKSLIRFYYSEWEYNGHLGGENFKELLSESNPIIERNKIEDDLWEEFIENAVSPAYEGYDKGVSIFSGYNNEHEGLNLPLNSIRSEECQKINKIKKRLETENYFNLEPILKDIIQSYKYMLDKKILKGEAYFRARIGFLKSKQPIVGSLDLDFHYEPFMNDAIAAPKPGQCKSGRINREGVSYLYLSELSDTAIAEVRPHPGNFVSVGKFIVTEDVDVADFSDDKIFYFSKSDQELDKFVTLNTINMFLNQIVAPEDRHNYSITQLIADCLRNMEYQGILFNSTVGPGKNLVLFSPEKMKYINHSRKVVIVKDVKYKYKELDLVDESEDYHEDIAPEDII